MTLSSLVLASHNQGKLREFDELLKPLGITITSAAALGLPEPEETGDTFEANAELKARAAAHASGQPALSDDSGLVIPALDGAPGIYSARWAGPNKDFTAAFAHIQKELAARNVPETTDAYFICVLCLAFPQGIRDWALGIGNATNPQSPMPNLLSNTLFFEGRISGTLTFPPRGTHGFGYDPIFIPEGHTRTFGEFPSQEKHAISHRARAASAFIDFLRIAA